MNKTLINVLVTFLIFCSFSMQAKAQSEHDYSREVIASYPDKIIAIRLQAKGASKLPFQIKMNRPVTTGEYIDNYINPKTKLVDINRALTEAKRDNYLIMRGQLFPNFFAAHKRSGHDVSGMEANLAFPGVMAEMLLQSHNDYIALLPALPSNWENGSIKGLCARGGFFVDIIWENGVLKSATIRSRAGKKCKLKYGEKIIVFNTREGESFKFDNSLSNI